MKKEFEEPNIEIFNIVVEDVITESDADPIAPTPGGNGSPIIPVI